MSAVGPKLLPESCYLLLIFHRNQMYYPAMLPERCFRPSSEKVQKIQPGYCSSFLTGQMLPLCSCPCYVNCIAAISYNRIQRGRGVITYIYRTTKGRSFIGTFSKYNIFISSLDLALPYDIDIVSRGLDIAPSRIRLAITKGFRTSKIISTIIAYSHVNLIKTSRIAGPDYIYGMPGYSHPRI